MRVQTLLRGVGWQCGFKPYCGVSAGNAVQTLLAMRFRPYCGVSVGNEGSDPIVGCRLAVLFKPYCGVSVGNAVQTLLHSVGRECGLGLAEQCVLDVVCVRCRMRVGC